MANQFTKARRERHFEETREKIQAAQLINRFMSHFMGKIELTPAQVASGKALLNKVLPDLQATTFEGSMEHKYVARMPDSQETSDAWQKQHSPTLQ